MQSDPGIVGMTRMRRIFGAHGGGLRADQISRLKLIRSWGEIKNRYLVLSGNARAFSCV
jgi:hypothetical protein